MLFLHIGWGEYSGPFFVVVKNKEPADHFKCISELHGCIQLILVWPFVGPARYIADIPMCGSGNTLWHPEQCLQQTSPLSPSHALVIQGLLYSICICLLALEFCLDTLLTSTWVNMCGDHVNQQGMFYLMACLTEWG